MDVNRDLPGLAVLGSRQLEETLEGCPQAALRLFRGWQGTLTQSSVTVFSSSLHRKQPGPHMDVWFRESREPLP